ncbi:VOC family protein [Parvularcula sp. IMCC14364]|uniref:VOC family protein n=1 Tax=Parvularcula sp. IMCC14364 TaxID=3067902 RepID=UPI0027417947|nr:VOC family protein [Parvularcula sp. IMCC14364]
MKQILSAISLIVADYDEAIEFYVTKLGFDLLEDMPLSADKRWVRVAPPNACAQGSSLLLAKAASENQNKAIGNQTGGRVFLFLHTDDFERDYSRFKHAGVNFREEPRNESYGRVVVFEDLYGNLWDLIQNNSASDE